MSVGTILCEKCGMPQAKHKVCGNCGFYKGTDILNLKAKTDKKAAKKESKKNQK